MRVLFLPPYSIQWASSRYRAYRYAERLQSMGIKSTVLPSPERRRHIGESGCNMVEQQYSYRATMPELFRVFSEVMGHASTLTAQKSGIVREES